MGAGFIRYLNFNDSQVNGCMVGQQGEGSCGVLKT